MSASILDRENPGSVPFCDRLLHHALVEIRKTNRAGEFGFRIRCLVDGTDNSRLIGAGIQWRDDYDTAHGIRDGYEPGMRVSGGNNHGSYASAVLDAHTRLREACEAVGRYGATILHYVLVGDPESAIAAYQPLSALALGKKIGRTDKEAHGLAIATMERLAEWYERSKR